MREGRGCELGNRRGNWVRTSWYNYLLLSLLYRHHPHLIAVVSLVSSNSRVVSFFETPSEGMDSGFSLDASPLGYGRTAPGPAMYIHQSAFHVTSQGGHATHACLSVCSVKRIVKPLNTLAMRYGCLFSSHRL